MIPNFARRGDDRYLPHEQLTRPRVPIGLVPRNRALQSFAPREQWLPTQHAIDLRPVAGVADHLTGSVVDEPDPIGAVVHQADDVASDIANRAMLTTRDVEGLAVHQFVGSL